MDFSVSMVPFSYSLATTRDVSRAPAMIIIIAMMPGIMKFLLRRFSLNPYPQASVYRWVHYLHTGPVQKIRQDFLVVGIDETVHVSHGYVGEIGVASIKDNLHWCQSVGPQVFCPACRDDKCERSPAVVKVAVDFIGGIN